MFCILFGFMCFVCQLIIIKRVALTYICLCTVDCTQRIYIYPYRTDRTPSPRHPKLRRLSPPPVGSYTDRQVVQYTSRQSKERRLNLIKKTRGGGAFRSVRTYILRLYFSHLGCKECLDFVTASSFVPVQHYVNVWFRKKVLCSISIVTYCMYSICKATFPTGLRKTRASGRRSTWPSWSS